LGEKNGGKGLSKRRALHVKTERQGSRRTFVTYEKAEPRYGCSKALSKGEKGTKVTSTQSGSGGKFKVWTS